MSQDVGNRVMGGIAGAVAGGTVGGWIGYHLDRQSGPCDDFCGLGGLLIGGLLGESAGVVAGMALAGPGSRPTDLLVSTGIALGGVAAAAMVHQGLVVVAIPVAQIAVLADPGTPPGSAGTAPN